MFQTPVSDMLLWIGAGELLVIRCITAVKSGVNRPVAIKQEATVLYSRNLEQKKVGISQVQKLQKPDCRANIKQGRIGAGLGEPCMCDDQMPRQRRPHARAADVALVAHIADCQWASGMSTCRFSVETTGNEHAHAGWIACSRGTMQTAPTARSVVGWEESWRNS